jgi:hypothetical protein
MLLEQATSAKPEDRPSIRELADTLATWSTQPRNVDDLAARELQRRAIDHIANLLATSLDPEASDEAERYLAKVIPESLSQGTAFRRDFEIRASERIRADRADYFAGSGIKGVLHLSDTVWPGDLAATNDFAEAILRCPASERDNQLYRAWQVLMGRPLWWMHIVALGGLLKLVLTSEPHTAERWCRRLGDPGGGRGSV